MVASTHWLASGVGMRMLESGGNAFDAAVAAGFTLTVVEPHMNGLGGDAPLLGHRASDGHTFVICGQGTAPALATIDSFHDLGLDLVPGTGHLAAVVPGAFGAWLDLLARYGTLPLADVLAPAIGYARDGYPIVPDAAHTISAVADLFADHWTSSAEIYLPAPSPGSRFTNPQLAETLSRLADQKGTREQQIEAARRAFYEGFVAEAVDSFVSGTPVLDSSGRLHAGFLRGSDLAGWRATEEPTVSVRFADRTIHKTAAWGQGPVLLQQLAMLDALGVTADADPVDLVHTVVEVAKLAFADREAWYGDVPDVPLATLLSSSYAAGRAGLVGATAAEGLLPGSPDGRTPRLAASLWDSSHVVTSAFGVGEPVTTVRPASGDTCHLDVVDRWGNRISATPSGGWLQSSPAVPGLGFSLPTRAQMFWLEPGLPASLAPGRRPRTTLSPGMVLDDDGSGLAFGTPGGDQQDQWTVPFLLRHLLGGYDLQAAIDAPTWHSTHVPSSFYPRTHSPRGVVVESRLGAHVLTGLAGRGHAVHDAGPWAAGRLSAAGTRADGLLVAAANPRGMQGYAVGR
ncbi:gamma-glutamyltransferase family protein [Cellulomonas sp. URHE0023]|uniref:gamma-glutamyltransferase family protein n=1 Tax=Cellulomonas sp. URHE0023 TaxID=1380354 RepID=UPI001E55EA46|nr:gamma-glutamyltransferase family protein [Cellulomonas sp. URHE0023]